MRGARRLVHVGTMEGITANQDVCRLDVKRSVGAVIALSTLIGYERACALAAEAIGTGRGILELVRERKILSEEQIARVLEAKAMSGDGRPV